MPLEVGMRHYSGPLLQIDQQSGEGVGNYWAFRLQNAMFATKLTGDVQSLFEVRRVTSFDFEETQTRFSN